MRVYLIWLLCLLGSGLVAAQDHPDSYQIALERIREAETSGATFLALSELHLTELPPEIGDLSHLLQLDLSYNQLTSIPPEIGNLANLQMLKLQDNQLNQIPAAIGDLNSLQWLDLSNNQLSALPIEIGNLSHLQVLDLSNNQLSTLPAAIGNLNSLERLELGSNHLHSLPPEIGNLRNLCHLGLVNNQLQQLPTSLGQLDRLASDNPVCANRLTVYGLDIYNNPLLAPSAEVLAQGTPAILAYLRDEAAWHIRKWIAGMAASVGLFIVGIGLLRGRQRYNKQKRT